MSLKTITSFKLKNFKIKIYKYHLTPYDNMNML